jgi:hypothetical protein
MALLTVFWPHDIQHNGTQHNDTHHYNESNGTRKIMTVYIMALDTECCNAECHIQFLIY